MRSSDDRRKRKRMALRWPLRLSRRPGKWSVESTTENLSSEGLFCVTKKPFKPGERLQCEMVTPGESFGSAEASLRLKCFVTVRRVEYLHSGFGLGCHIPETRSRGIPSGHHEFDPTDH